MKKATARAPPAKKTPFMMPKIKIIIYRQIQISRFCKAMFRSDRDRRYLVACDGMVSCDTHRRRQHRHVCPRLS